MAEDAAFLPDAVRKYDLDIASPRELEGLIKRHPWLDIGHIPAGRYDLEHPSPSADRLVAHVDTLVVTDACARRAERVALLTLLSAELPGFLRSNPPKSADTMAGLSLAPEARPFFVSGEPEMADRYFPWLVNLMSPVYWVYLAMAVTILFNAMRGFSRFRLWRIDAAREKLKAQIDAMVGPAVGHPQPAPIKGGRGAESRSNESRADAGARHGAAHGVAGALPALHRLDGHADGRRDVLSVPGIADQRASAPGDRRARGVITLAVMAGLDPIGAKIRVAWRNCV